MGSEESEGESKNESSTEDSGLSAPEEPNKKIEKRM